MSDILDDPELIPNKEIIKYGSKSLQFTIFGRTFKFETFIEGVKPPNIFSCSEQLCDRPDEVIMSEAIGKVFITGTAMSQEEIDKEFNRRDAERSSLK